MTRPVHCVFVGLPGSNNSTLAAHRGSGSQGGRLDPREIVHLTMDLLEDQDIPIETADACNEGASHGKAERKNPLASPVRFP